ncbi:MAG: hypothetical protein KBD00_05125 [Candidatus Peribacteraceae bacterium]|nr:hypothetical protein [Candidatus Peribacteraceae bacterium]
MPPEQPPAAHQNIERGKEAPQSDLSKALTSFSHALHHNDNFPVVTDTDSEQELLQKEDALTRDGKYDSAKEFYLTSKIIRQRDVIQQEKAAKESSNKQVKDPGDYVVAHEALTYNEYFLSLLERIEDLMKNYQKERNLLTDIPPELEAKEKQAANFIFALRYALDERREFASVRLSDYMLRSARGKPDALRKNIQEFTDPNVLRPDSVAAFKGGDATALIHGNKLDQQIINIVAGKADIPGVEKGFNPTHIYFELLKYKYEKLLSKQRQDARDGEGTQFSEDSKEGKERKRLSQELVKVTQEMGIADIQLAELATVNNLLGKHFNLADALPPRTEQTPEEIRKAVHEAMKQRSDYHLGQMEQFSQVVDTVVLSEGVVLHLDDFWTKNGRNGVKFVSEKVAGVVSLVVPKTAGMRQWAYDELTDPISDAMGWPKGKEKWEELTPDEQEKVRQKSKSILDTVRNFDRTSIAKFTGTISMIRSMPDPATLIDQAKNVPDELPTDEVRTPEQLANARSKYGDATAYCMLFKQLEVDWGDSKEGTGFMGQYSLFFDRLEKVIGTKLDVGRGNLEVASKWGGISLSAGILALFGLLGAAALAAYLAKKMTQGALKLTSKVAKESVKAGAKGTRAGLDALRKSVSKGTNPAPTGVAAEAEALKDIETIIAENAPKTASKLGKAVKILGTAGFIFSVGMTGKEIYERLDEQASLAPIKDEQERIKAALAFLESPEAKRTLNIDAAYNRAVNLLTDRLQSIISLRDALKIVPDLPDSVDPTQKSALIQMQTKVLAKQGQLLQDAQQVHNYCAKRMPIDDLMSKDTRTGQYKVDVGGGIGIFSGGKLQDAMQASDPKASSALSMEQELDIGLLRRNLEKQTEDYTQSLKEYLNVLAAAIKQ